MLAAYCGGSVDFVRDMHPDMGLMSYAETFRQNWCLKEMEVIVFHLRISWLLSSPITLDVRGKAALSSRMNMPAKAVAEDKGRCSDSLDGSQYMYWGVVAKGLQIKAGPSFNAVPQLRICVAILRPHQCHGYYRPSALPSGMRLFESTVWIKPGKWLPICEGQREAQLELREG